MINILVIEDDNDINRLLCNIIRKNGYMPQSTFSGTEALLYLTNGQEWDMILLDLMLPGLTGEELLPKITEHTLCPVMIISAKGKQQTKVATLRLGADDFITKPFDIEEVSARIDSHLRRYRRILTQQQNKQLTFKDIILDLMAKTVVANGIQLSLTAREFSILELFLASPKKVFTKANVFESVWGDAFCGDDNTISVHMSNLRSKLSKANPNGDYIETIWGMGYRLKS